MNGTFIITAVWKRDTLSFLYIVIFVLVWIFNQLMLATLLINQQEIIFAKLSKDKKKIHIQTDIIRRIC